MNKTTSIIVGLVIIFGVGGAVYWQKNASTAVAPTIQGVTGVVGTSGVTNSAGSETINTANSGSTNGELRGENEGDDDSGSVSTPVHTPVSTPTPSSSGTVTTGGISVVTVATHNLRSSCWSIINGNVYDLTSWIPQHPGGEQAILQLCGTDGSVKYNRQHGSAIKQATILAGFKIGVAK